jgi:hypothetical protein
LDAETLAFAGEPACCARASVAAKVSTSTSSGAIAANVRARFGMVDLARDGELPGDLTTSKLSLILGVDGWMGGRVDR